MIEVYYYDKKLRKGTTAQIKDLIKTRKRFWIDISDPSQNEVALMKELFALHPITAEDILTTNTRAKIEQFEDYLFVVLYGIYKHKNIRLREMDFVLGKNFLVTAHKQTIEGFDKFKRDERKMEQLLKQGMDFFMHNLIDIEVDNFLPVLELFDEVIDKIEDTIIANPNKRTMEKILDLKRRMSKIKKIIIPQQEKISFLAKNKYSLISPSCQTYFRDVHDHFYTVTDMIEDYREALSSSFDAYMSSISNDMNQVMKVLSVMATIMLPLTVISGVYGMNFLVIPGARDPAGFWYVIGLMVILIVVMLGLFKKKGWM